MPSQMSYSDHKCFTDVLGNRYLTHHMWTIQLISRANYLTGFYMIGVLFLTGSIQAMCLPEYLHQNRFKKLLVRSL